MSKISDIKIEDALPTELLDSQVMQFEATLIAMLGNPPVEKAVKAFGNWLISQQSQDFFDNYHDHPQKPVIQDLLKQLADQPLSSEPLFDASLRIKLLALSIACKPFPKIEEAKKNSRIKIWPIIEEDPIPVIPAAIETVSSTQHFPDHPNQIIIGDLSPEEIASARKGSAWEGFRRNPMIVSVAVITAIAHDMRS